MIFLRPGQLEFVHCHQHSSRSFQNRFRAVFVATWAILPESPEIAFSAFPEPSAWSISLQSEPDRRAKKRSAVLVAIPTFSHHSPNIFPVSHRWHSHRCGDIGSDPSYNKSCLAVWKTMSRIAGIVGEYLEFLQISSRCGYGFRFCRNVSLFLPMVAEFPIRFMHTHTHMALIHGVSCTRTRIYVSVAAWWQRFHHLHIWSEQMHTFRAGIWPGSQILRYIMPDDFSYHGSFRQMFWEYELEHTH